MSTNPNTSLPAHGIKNGSFFFLPFLHCNKRQSDRGDLVCHFAMFGYLYMNIISSVMIDAFITPYSVGLDTSSSLSFALVTHSAAVTSPTWVL